MTAEKRESDGLIQVVVLPESSNVEFPYVDMIECKMGAKWKYGEPMVKVYGEIIVNNRPLELTNNCITSIFYKNVSEFSFKKEEGKQSLIFQKTCDSKGIVQTIGKY